MIKTNSENLETVRERERERELYSKELKRGKVKQRGITLVALVITMVILIILATVTISATFGDNGLLKQAEKTKDIATNSIAKENEDLNRLEQEYANMMADDGEIPDPPKDTTGPTVTITTGEITENSIAVMVNAVDNESGLAESGTYKYYLNGVEQKTDTANSYTYTGLTAETEYTIKVEAFDKVGNKGGNSITVSTEKKAGVDAGEIEKNPTAYYGSEVRGYTCTSQGVSKWRIFYADSTNIYLIADDYISYKYAPKGKAGTDIAKNYDYRLNFGSLYNDYIEGASWIDTNSKGKKWLNKFLSIYKTNQNVNIRSVAYIMDTNAWNEYTGEYAEYAMGSPTIELYCESYKNTHPNKYIMYDSITSNGYKLKWNDDSSYVNTISGLARDEYNSIYIKSDNNKAGAMWIASPTAYHANCLLHADYNGYLDVPYFNATNTGLRPLVCLKSGVQLRNISEGVYEIVK